MQPPRRHRRHSRLVARTVGGAAALFVLALLLSLWNRGPRAIADTPDRANDSAWIMPRNLPPPIDVIPARSAVPDRVGPVSQSDGVTAAGPPSRLSGGSAGPASSDTLSAMFGLCHSGGGRNCVVDGDTFWFGGAKIRIADIDTPETHGPRCADEAARGAAATRRLQQLLNAEAFSLTSVDRDTDRYDRQLRVVMRNGSSIGQTLVDEGLARWYGGGRQPWCHT